jgi:aspartate oxidase
MARIGDVGGCSGQRPEFIQFHPTMLLTVQPGRAR